jgi:hypothetical protein
MKTAMIAYINMCRARPLPSKDDFVRLMRNSGTRPDRSQAVVHAVHGSAAGVGCDGGEKRRRGIAETDFLPPSMFPPG